MPSIIRVSVLGIGFSANAFQIPYILALPEVYKLHSILERSATKESSKARDKYGHLGVKVVTTIDDVVNDPEVDLVVVAVKDHAHYEYSRLSLEAGKHVILEKPITATSEQAHHLGELAKSRGLVYAPFHNRRFDGDFRTVKKLIDDGKLKEVVDFESRFDVRAEWAMGQPGGSAGIIYGLGTHIIDQVIALYGKPSSVTALLDNGRGWGHPDVDDSFILHLRFPNTPVLVTLRSALHSVMDRQVRFIIRAKDASYVKYGLDPQEPQVANQGMKPTDKGFGEEEPSSWGVYTRFDGKNTISEKIRTEPGSYKDYYQNVADAIHGRAPLVVTPEHAELGIRIIEVAKKSASEKRTIEM